MSQQPAPTNELGWLWFIEELIQELQLHCKDPIHAQQLLDVRAYQLALGNDGKSSEGAGHDRPCVPPRATDRERGSAPAPSGTHSGDDAP